MYGEFVLAFSSEFLHLPLNGTAVPKSVKNLRFWDLLAHYRSPSIRRRYTLPFRLRSVFYNLLLLRVLRQSIAFLSRIMPSR